MTGRDISLLKANFVYLRKNHDFVTHQFIQGYISALQCHAIIDSKTYLKISGIADDYLIN